MKVTALGRLGAATDADETPFLARPSTWLFIGALGVVGWIVYEDTKHGSRGLSGVRRRRSRR